MMWQVGLLPQLGGCDFWQLHRPGVNATYGLEVWSGSSPEDVQQGAKPIQALPQVSVTKAGVQALISHT